MIRTNDCTDSVSVDRFANQVSWSVGWDFTVSHPTSGYRNIAISPAATRESLGELTFELGLKKEPGSSPELLQIVQHSRDLKKSLRALYVDLVPVDPWVLRGR